MSSPLKLLAQDAEDLTIIAAAIQDSVGKIGDIRFDVRQRRLTIGLNRYRWESDARERVRCLIEIGSVLSVKSRRLRRTAREAIVEVLSLEFEIDTLPGGSLTVTYAGGGDLRIQVECIDVILADVSEPWSAKTQPDHEQA